MSDIWGTIKGLLTRIDYRKVYVDNTLFRLHYKFTGVILVVFGILVTSRQYIGDPIDCITDLKAERIVDQYCWVHGTYTKGQLDKLQRKYGYAQGQEEVIPDRFNVNGRPDPLNLNERNLQDWEKQFHTYYQWIWCLLFFQAFLFFIPHWIWKTWEAGRLKTLVADLNTHVLDETKKTEHKAAILEYFSPSKEGKWYHNMYSYKYAFCEVLNFINILTQVFLIDAYLDYEFSTYGMEVFSISQNRAYYRNDKMSRVFPTVTMCEIRVFGFAGNLNSIDALCVLPINILNEKIYIFMWFWFLILTILSGLGLAYRVATMLPFPRLKAILLKRVNPSVSNRTLDTISTKSCYGDWFMLYRLGRNMNPIYFGELLRDLVNKIDGDGNAWDLKPIKMSEYDRMDTMEVP